MNRFPGRRTGMSFSLPALCAALWKASLGFQLGLSGRASCSFVGRQ